MKTRRQKGGIPAGSAALAAVAKEEVSKGKAVDRLAALLGSAVLVKRGFRGRSVPASFLDEVGALVAEGMHHTPSSLKAQAEKHGISLPDLVAAIRGKNTERLRRILARPNARADAAMEEVFEADDQEVKAKIEKFYKDHPEWSHDKPDKILPEWDFIKGEWLAENPGKTPKPGEVVRWQAARQKKSDEARAAASVNLKARAKAAGDRDITPPVLLGDELVAALESLRQIPWEDREQWPTKDDVRISTGMSCRELGRILKGGRWKGRKNRNVWKGSGCKSSRGGRPLHKISPVGMQRIIRAFLKRRKLPVDRARKLLDFLGRVKF
jgi:hypothetical protein